MLSASRFLLASVLLLASSSVSFFFTATATTEIYTLSLHDALPICCRRRPRRGWPRRSRSPLSRPRSEEHTSEFQSRENLVCRLLLEKKKTNSLRSGRSKRNLTEREESVE